MKYFLIILILMGCGDPEALKKKYNSLKLPPADHIDFEQYSNKADLFIAYWWPTSSYHKSLGTKEDYETWINNLTYEVVLRGNQLKEATKSKYIFEQNWSTKEACLNCACHLYYDCSDNMVPNQKIADQCFDIEMIKLDFLQENVTIQSRLLTEMEKLLDPLESNTNWITTASTYNEISLHLFPTIHFGKLTIHIPLLGLNGDKKLSYNSEKNIDAIKLKMLESGAELTFKYYPQKSPNQVVQVNLSLSQSIGKLLAFGETFLYQNGVQINRGLMIMEFPKISNNIECNQDHAWERF